jgi:molybdenum cofactor synthesis domain-containing protein
MRVAARTETADRPTPPIYLNQKRGERMHDVLNFSRTEEFHPAEPAIISHVFTVEILTIGNEILLGLVQDTNSNYLCRVVRGMGGNVRRIAVVPDKIDDIVHELRASMDRGTDVVFTAGGLGPTDDDLTLAAVAKATGRPLVLDPAAAALVENKYRELAAQGHVQSGGLTESRSKMARMPNGSRPVPNPVGAAPASVVEIENSRIISLPGVPAELKAIVEGPLQSFLSEVFGQGSYREREILVDCGDESELAPALRQVVAANPDVYVKSRASRFGPDVKFRVLLAATAADANEAEAKIQRASDELLSLIPGSANC